VSGSEVGSCHQQQNSKGGKAQGGQYMAGWAGLLQASSPKSINHYGDRKIRRRKSLKKIKINHIKKI
jgi:hypothetical protein